jgi:sporulation protein YlmC with PRC-barrel domain
VASARDANGLRQHRRVIRLSQLIGQRVVTRDGGHLLGGIERVLLDVGRGAISVAQLQPPTGGQVIFEWSAVAEIGRDAVIASESRTREPEGELEQRLVRGELELMGKTVLTEEGSSLGELEDLEIDESSGQVIRIQLPNLVVPVDRFVAVGPDVVIIAATMANPTAGSAS